jgi:hypothetical protein
VRRVGLAAPFSIYHHPSQCTHLPPLSRQAFSTLFSHAPLSTPSPPPLPPSADDLVYNYYDDLHSFDPATRTWTLLSAANDTRRPSARSGHGFTSAGGLLYVHGGYSNTEGDADAVGRV